MNRLSYLFPLLLLLLLVFTACGDDDDPIIENEEEVITNVVYVLTPVDSGETVTLRYEDLDGDGPGDASMDVTGALLPNTTYQGAISLSNQSDPNDIEDITAEIAEEADDHQFFYIPSGGLNATFTYSDTDAGGNPVGLLTEMRTGDASSGSIQIILRHEPDKGAGATVSDPAGAGGETDIAVTFDVAIED